MLKAGSVGDQRASSERGQGEGGERERRRRARYMHTKEGTHSHAATKKGNTARKKKKGGPEPRENRQVNDYKPSTRAIWICIALDFGGTHPLYCIRKPRPMRKSKWRMPLDYAPRMRNCSNQLGPSTSHLALKTIWGAY